MITYLRHATAVGVLWFGSIAWAQDRPAKHYHNKTSFRIPVVIDDSEREGLMELQLWVRRLPGEWNCVAKAPPTQTTFTYQAPAEGEYWLSVATVDRQGKMVPPDLPQQAPALIVVVDTQAPNVEVKPLSPAGEAMHLQCRLLDANPDYSTLQVSAMAPDGTWKPLPAVSDAPGVFKLVHPMPPDARVLVKASDRAGNVTEREVEVGISRADAKRSPLPAVPIPTTPDDPLHGVTGIRSVPDTKPPASSPLPRPGERPIVIPPPSGEKSISKKPAIPATKSTPPVVTEMTEGGPLPPRVASQEPLVKPPEPAPFVSTNATAGGPLSAIVNSLRCRLDFALDPVPGGVAEIEVWASTDNGRTWKSVGLSPDGKSPATIEFPSEGKYSLAFVVRPVMGLASALPKPGDPPDGYIEIDTTLPVASLTEVRPGVGPDAGFLLLTWKAEDANLAEEPIAFWYATQLGGPWQMISERVANSGSYRWALPKNIASPIWVRMEVRDRAGNITRCETPQPIALEGPRAKVRVLNIAATRD